MEASIVSLVYGSSRVRLVHIFHCILQILFSVCFSHGSIASLVYGSSRVSLVSIFSISIHYHFSIFYLFIDSVLIDKFCFYLYIFPHVVVSNVSLVFRASSVSLAHIFSISIHYHFSIFYLFIDSVLIDVYICTVFLPINVKYQGHWATTLF